MATVREMGSHGTSFPGQSKRGRPEGHPLPNGHITQEKCRFSQVPDAREISYLHDGSRRREGAQEKKFHQDGRKPP
jgi:hypothetical protein